MRRTRKKKKRLWPIAIVLLLMLSLFCMVRCSTFSSQVGDESLAQNVVEEQEDTGETDSQSDDSDTEEQNNELTSEGDDVASPTYVPSKEIRTVDDGNVLVLVNKEYAVSEDYEPIDMVDVDGSLSTNQGLKVKAEAYEAYLLMLADAQAEGLNFCICSAYRSYALQESLYNNSVATNGLEYTETLFAYPGKSEHHTGYAIDITSASMNWGLSQDFADYADGAWITEHCYEYGFIIRYMEGKEDITGYVYEPWHIRYVGVEVATYITENGLTLEEYLGVA